MTEKEIIQEAVYTFGSNHQKLKAVEEMSELIKEIMKDLDGKGNLDHIAEEMADVEITLEQLKLICSNTAMVIAYKRKKLERLWSLIFEERNGNV